MTRPAPVTLEATPWTAVVDSFAALGRVVLLLDANYRVVQASPLLDELVCDGTAERIIGHLISDLLGSRLFVPGDAVHKRLSQGLRVEGRRAFIKCSRTGAQLVSVSAAPLPRQSATALHWEARFMVVVRSARDDEEAGRTGTYGLMAKSPEMLQIVSLIEALMESEATVLITGETGTGKGAVAAALHAHSPRRKGPFVTVDAGALHGELLESELFGHVRGAFTGAHRDRVGQIELARGGTLFLDEIGDLPLPMQGKLLRLVQEREYRRLGESTVHTMDARIIAATHVDMDAAVAAGRFRQDLYYRLRVVPITLPPLRARLVEIEPLAHYLLKRIGAATGRAVRLSPEALDVLTSFVWPGNVRQLDNALEFAVAICRGQTILPEHLPLEVRAPVPSPALAPQNAAPMLGAVFQPSPDAADRVGATRAAGDNAHSDPGGDECVRIRDALQRHQWNRNAAAAALGISRTTLWRKMRQLGIG